MDAQARAIAAFEDRFGTTPPLLARAPGRVNLIGEHTDYNDGFVLPMALPFDTVIAFRPRPDTVVSVSSAGFGEATFDLPDDPQQTETWARYVHGMGHLLHGDGVPVAGWDGCIETDIPAGASLSSSAALEVATGIACAASKGEVELDAGTLARTGQRVENDVFGFPSGIMDQLASAGSAEGCASLIDCRDLSIRQVRLPDSVAVVIMDTGTRRELVESEYADRQATCVRVAAELGVDALRDATLADVDRLDPADQVGRDRATHVIEENERTLSAVQVAEAGDMEALGALFNESHASLRDLYEVSGPALDAITEIARAHPACLGARMTGGGFAGGSVALVHADQVEAFCAAIEADYRAPEAQPAVQPTALWPVTAGPGAALIRR